MNAQKFVAPTMKEALARIKEELGDDALILKSEKVKIGGALGFKQKEMIEVTAATADEVKQDLQGGPDFAETLDDNLSKPAKPRVKEPSDEDLQRLRDELRQVREEMSGIGKFLRYKNLPNLPHELARLWETIGDSGVSREWATHLAEEALLRLGPEELISGPAVENYLLSRILSVVKPAPAMNVRRASPYVVMFVGSPGAGKTTLLQKLASDPLAYAKRKVGLITLDTHRMAAVEQLRAFARIAGTPLEPVYNFGQAGAALHQLSTCEVILIDTMGCTAADDERLTVLRSFVDVLNPDEIHLVQNCAVRDEDLVYAGRKFREVGISHLSFTRLDEALRHGYLVNVIKMIEKPVGWISHGQNFIGSVERFTPEHLRRWIVLSEPEREIIAEKVGQTTTVS
jgi:flagellar biosynthesis protein FlhF